MILRRLGNKKKLAEKIIPHFPAHKIYIEPFFGAGGMFFNKPKAEYNIMNDLDSDVFNLFQVVLNQKEDLKNVFYITPIHSALLKYWKANIEIDPIKKAIRFLFLSNFTLYGKMDTIKWSTRNEKDVFFKNIDACFKLLYNVRFNNIDFKQFFINLQFGESDIDKNKTFIYCDPPYLGTTNTYSNSFSKQDSMDLFDCLISTGSKFMYSEFNNSFIIKQAKKRNLNIIKIGERSNLKNRRIEILITNYKTIKTGFFK